MRLLNLERYKYNRESPIFSVFALDFRNRQILPLRTGQNLLAGAVFFSFSGAKR